MYLVFKDVLRCAVGVTNRRVLIVDLATGPGAKPTRELPIDAQDSLAGRSGLVPQLTVREGDAVLKVAFPLNVRGNKEQAVAIVQRFASK